MCFPEVVNADPAVAGEVGRDGGRLAGCEHRQQPPRQKD